MGIKNIFREVQKIIPEVYLVGGSVRDILLGKEPKDYDFCTSLLPEEIEKRVQEAGRKAYSVGKKFGTIGFKVEVEPKKFEYVEVTTFRGEKYKAGSRHPEVEFCTNLEDDLSRRDFTINALAWDGTDITLDGETTLQIIDPFLGRTDLINKTIRAVGNPITRFREDPLRLLRAIRFATQLDFIIEEKTLDAIAKKNYKILQISKERWVQELDKILLSNNVALGLNLLAETKLLNFIIPELSLQVGYNQNNPYHTLTLWEHTVKTVEGIPKDIDLRWAALLHDIGKPFVQTVKTKNPVTNPHWHYIKHDLIGAEIVERIANHLRWSNDRKDKVISLVLNHMNDENSPLREADRKAH